MEALRAAGDNRPLRALLTRQFPATLAIEVLLGMTVLMAAPFLHGSARNQAFQAAAAKHATTDDDLPQIPAKNVGTSTWIWGAGETAAVLAVMVAGYRISGHLARCRTGPTPVALPDHGSLAET